MPELPEVEALAVFLRDHAGGRVVARAEAASFAVLKTFDPPLPALAGRVITAVGRRGKFLDLTCGGSVGGAADGATDELHLVMHLARAGWLRWRDDIPDKPVRPGKSPLAFRLVLDDGSGFDLTEAGTQKRLAVYLVHDPGEVPGVASLGPEPLADDFTTEALAAILKERRTQIKGVLRDQHIIAGIGNAYSDEVLHVAKMSPFKLASSFTAEDVATLHAAVVTTLRDAVERRQDWRRPTSRARRRPGSGYTARPGSPARSAATRSARSLSPIHRCSTAPPARQAASRSRTVGCPGSSSYRSQILWNGPWLRPGRPLPNICRYATFRGEN